jgi:pimeloyl-ACP methyl ester carboxylesterase
MNPSPRPGRPASRRLRGGIALVALASMIAASCSGDDDASDTTVAATAPATTAPATTAPATTEPATTEPATTAIPEDFDPYAQTLDWTECDSGECAEAIVPIDYADPSAGTTTIALARQQATGEKIGTLFINPGGPGGSGVDFLGAFALLVSPEVSDAYDIVGFDPRGVGASDPLGCLDTEDLDTLLATDVDPDDPTSVEAYAALVEGQAEACLATNPQLAQHVTTVETAMDLDVLRALVGDDQLHYYGASYGTFLGATYAALFPEHAGRLVLDGAMDPSLSAAQTALRQAGGFQLAFDDYAADCVANECEVGGSVDKIEQQVIDLFATTQDSPLPTDDPDRPLTQALAFYGIAEPLYSQELWPVLTDALVAASDGDGTTLLALADEYNQRTPDGYATNLQQANSAINGLDCKIAPEPESTPTEDDFLAASPLFGAIVFGYVEVGCDAWPIVPTVDAPDYTAEGAAPILVVGTTGDPATPIQSAEKLADQLDSGVLLIRDGEGHTAYFSGDTCISDIIDAFLVDGTVPEDGTECPIGTEATTTTPASTNTTAAPSETTAPTEATTTTVAASVPSGIVTLTVAGDTVFTGDITSCTLVEPDVTFTAQSETAEMEVGVGTDGDIFVTVTGVYEFEGTGTVSFGPDTGIDQGDVTITGSGAQPDDAAAVEDFVLEAGITSC